MALKTYNPTTPGQRGLVLIDRSQLYKGRPVKALTEGLTKKGGRNNTGRITARRRGGGAKTLYRIVDFKRRKLDVPGKVIRIEYDPNRTAFIALIGYADGEQAYILAPQRLAVGDSVIAANRADIKPGNAMPFASMPIGTIVHNVEMKPGKGGQIARSAGTYAQFGPRWRLRADPPVLRRTAPCAPGVHGHGWRGVESRQLEPELRQGRPHAALRQAPKRSRRRHEPHRPPARRW
jgi:large subunit ribosomal protein L2